MHMQGREEHIRPPCVLVLDCAYTPYGVGNGSPSREGTGGRRTWCWPLTETTLGYVTPDKAGPPDVRGTYTGDVDEAAAI